MSAKPSGNATRTVIAVVGTKGGIGKTTVTNGLAGALALKATPSPLSTLIRKVPHLRGQTPPYATAQASRTARAVPAGTPSRVRGPLDRRLDHHRWSAREH